MLHSFVILRLLVSGWGCSAGDVVLLSRQEDYITDLVRWYFYVDPHGRTFDTSVSPELGCRMGWWTIIA